FGSAARGQQARRAGLLELADARPGNPGSTQLPAVLQLQPMTNDQQTVLSRPPSPEIPSLLAVGASLGILAISVYFLVVGKDVFIPLVLGIFIAYLLVALSHMIERVKVGGKTP